MLKQFIEQLSKDLTLPEIPAQQEDGAYHLSFEPNVEISLRENPDSGITLMTNVAPLPKEKTEEFLLKALSANLLGRETGNNYLGLDSQDKVLLKCFMPLQVAYKEFFDYLEEFVNYAESWKEETARFVQESEGSLK